ncbi:Inositolphosphorylceramide synthase subunit Kei1-domain-containing protein [Podospora conica]|nr:Inositolphosphorylceramide synthase subunit Kei1-domain-containing protein [Schizothecium conicum]
MAAASRGCLSRIRLPRPRTFLGFMSLQTGAELVALALVFNKATGIYGFLTLFTGYAASALQVTSYLWSVLVIVGLALLVPHIRKQSPFQNLALAWLYILDTCLNTAYIAAFATIWYLSTFHDVEEIPAAPEAAAIGNDTGPRAAAEEERSNPDTAASMFLVVLFSVVRIYLALVVASNARWVLQRWGGEERGEAATESDIANAGAVNPFAEGTPLGEGWQGKMGRVMVSVGRNYWLGRHKEDEEWARGMASKFRSSTSREV